MSEVGNISQKVQVFHKNENRRVLPEVGARTDPEKFLGGMSVPRYVFYSKNFKIKYLTQNMVIKNVLIFFFSKVSGVKTFH